MNELNSLKTQIGSLEDSHNKLHYEMEIDYEAIILICYQHAYTTTILDEL